MTTKAACNFIAVFLCFGTMLSGCRNPGSQTPQLSSSTLHTTPKTFVIHGKIVSTDATHVTLDGENVPGFMEAMTMSYKLADPSIVSELHPGDRISAQVLTDQTPDGDFSNVRLKDVVVTAQARPDYKPMVQYHVPTVGDQIPDFKLINQDDRMIHLGQFRGKVVLMTFIYTRCQLADFCPRMSRNFADIDHALATNKDLYRQTHLLSVSFDPGYDTPKVLRSYGGAYTGNYTRETFSHWDFAAPGRGDLPVVSRFFDVGVTGDSSNPASITHSLSTVLIDKQGKVADWYPTNDWKPDDVLKQIKKLAAA